MTPKILARIAALPLLLGVVLFGAAGRLDVWFFWIYLGLVTGAFLLVAALAPPGLMEERMRPPHDRDRGTRLVSMAIVLGHTGCAGLDVGRLGWLPLPSAACLFGLVWVAIGLALVAWTLLSNPFASSAVRLQQERGQTVVSTGPYAFVRHPMYLGTLIFAFGSPLALGSLAAAWFSLPLVPLFVRRTEKEDRMLHEQLGGYRAYSSRVRFKVVPGLY